MAQSQITFENIKKHTIRYSWSMVLCEKALIL